MNSLSGRRMGEGGRYVIQEQIAAGDTGTIFLAQDTQAQKLVAIKLIHNHLVKNKRSRELFLKAAPSLTDLDHPNIVGFLEIINQNASIAAVMPFVEGLSLDHYLAQNGGRLDFEQALEIMAPVMEAVQFGHEHGVVHRNLKPGNIILDYSGGKTIPKVLDFGIANILGENADKSKVRAVIGTPSYMPPEQLKGAADMDGRGDVYALGAIWYQILTGQLPYGEGSEYEVTNRILSGEPLVSIKLHAKVPESVEQSILRAMAEDRNDRFANVREFLAVLTVPAVDAVWLKKPAGVLYPEAPPVARKDQILPELNIPRDAVKFEPAPVTYHQRAHSHRGLLIPFISIVMVIMLAGIIVGAWSMIKQSNRKSATSSIEAEKGERTARLKKEEEKRAEEEKLIVKKKMLLKAGQVETDSHGIEWAFIPEGSYLMSCSPSDDSCDRGRNLPHIVKFGAFQIMTHEMTQGEYRAITGMQPSHFKDCGDNCPVEKVGWYEAKQVCQKIGGRLPTEAEWEYAAKAGTVTKFYCGDDCLDNIAWHDGNSNGETHPVKNKKPNSWGLYDMLGNVWEWVEGCYRRPYAFLSDCTANVLRGGSWNVDARLESMEIRYILNPTFRYYSNGVRCARDEQP